MNKKVSQQLFFFFFLRFSKFWKGGSTNDSVVGNSALKATPAKILYLQTLVIAFGLEL